jgi:hypothetical protein
MGRLVAHALRGNARLVVAKMLASIDFTVYVISTLGVQSKESHLIQDVNVI